ncbi:Rpp14/Pop5 family-domain-containing protein, partial [Scleroderma citrinum]
QNRWFLVEFIAVSSDSSVALDGKQIHSALRQSIISNFGDAGWGAVGMSLTIKYFSPTTNICIVRVARDHHNLAWGAITLMTSINGIRVIPHVIHVSGTIKHTQLAAIKHNREIIARFRARAKTPASYHAQDSYEPYLVQSTREIETLQE